MDCRMRANQDGGGRYLGFSPGARGGGGICTGGAPNFDGSNDGRGASSMPTAAEAGRPASTVSRTEVLRGAGGAPERLAPFGLAGDVAASGAAATGGPSGASGPNSGPRSASERA